MKYSFSVLFMLCFWASCVEEYNADLGDSDSNLIIVQGNICSDSICSFSITHSVGLNESTSLNETSVNNATVSVEGSDGSVYTGKYNGNGEYLVPVGKLNSNTKYSLTILWDGVTFTSTPSVPLDSPEMEAVTYKQERADHEVDILVSDEVTDESRKGQFYRWTYTEDWEIHSMYKPIYEYNPETDKLDQIEPKNWRGWKSGQFQQLMNGNSSKFTDGHVKEYRLFSIDWSSDRISVLYCCNLKQYAISKEQYEYEEARLKISSDLGGLFAPLPAELPSNITCSDKRHRAIGFIGVCGKVASYRLWIPRGGLDYYDIVRSQTSIETDDEILKLSDYEKYCLGYRVCNEQMIMPGIPTDWIMARGIDVTLLGATLTPPDYWFDYNGE